jgi:hypothetical protein
MSALDRLKNIQSNFKKTWTGINCEMSGRAGTSNFVNKKRVFNLGDIFHDEEERQKQIHKIFSKLKDIEEDKLNTSSISTTSGLSGAQSTIS